MVQDANEETEYIELTIRPIPPDTVSSVKSELVPLIEAALRDAKQEQLLDSKELQVEVEKTFPTDLAIVVSLNFLSGIALETYKAIILPRLKKRFQVEEKRRRKVKGKKKS